MGNEKLVRLEKAISVLCIILCLLLVLPFGFELSAKAGSASVIVSPFDSIQAAINNATAGDTILVRAGIYNESLEVNKSISLIGENREQTFINGQNSQFIINITADNVIIEGFTIQSTSGLSAYNGISIPSSKGNVISHNKIENSQQGIAVTSSSNNVISDNIITANAQSGITLTSSSDNTISDNTITNTQQGITLTSLITSSSSNNTISDNIITNTQQGIALGYSSNNLFSGNLISGNSGGLSIIISGGNVFSGNTLVGNYPSGEIITYFSQLNTFYDNNFYDTIQVDPGLINKWDNGHEGNYWSSYNGTDSFGGSYQNVSGSDAIGDTPYVIDVNNKDNYPLMGKFSSFDATFASETFQISVISNSTVSNFKFEVGTETGNKIIQFNVTGAQGTIGFSRIAIPTELMSAPLLVLVGQREIVPTLLNIQNTALNYLYFTYSHSNQTILIISSNTLDLYNQLLDKFLTLNATYYAGLDNLNKTYNGLFNNYANLLGNYSQLQQDYSALNASYQQHLLDYSQNLQNVRSLMYTFVAATAILIVIIVYFSKHVFSRPKEDSDEKEPILS